MMSFIRHGSVFCLLWISGSHIVVSMSRNLYLDVGSYIASSHDDFFI